MVWQGLSSCQAILIIRYLGLRNHNSEMTVYSENPLHSFIATCDLTNSHLLCSYVSIFHDFM